MALRPHSGLLCKGRHFAIFKSTMQPGLQGGCAWSGDLGHRCLKMSQRLQQSCPGGTRLSVFWKNPGYSISWSRTSEGSQLPAESADSSKMKECPKLLKSCLVLSFLSHLGLHGSQSGWGNHLET